MATVYLHHNRPRQDRLGNPSLRSGLGSHSLRSLSVVCCIVPARNESFSPLADPAKNKQRSYSKEAIRGTRTMDGIMDETHPFIGYVSVGPLSLFPLGCTLLFDLSAYVHVRCKRETSVVRPTSGSPGPILPQAHRNERDLNSTLFAEMFFQRNKYKFRSPQPN
jgi:hypothetical protein